MEGRYIFGDFIPGSPLYLYFYLTGTRNRNGSWVSNLMCDYYSYYILPYTTYVTLQTCLIVIKSPHPSVKVPETLPHLLSPQESRCRTFYSPKTI